MPLNDVKASVFLPQDLHLAATIIAKESKKSLSQLIAELVSKHVNSKPPKKKRAA